MPPPVSGGKFASGINDTSGTGGIVTDSVVDNRVKFATSVVDTDGKFAP